MTKVGSTNIGAYGVNYGSSLTGFKTATGKTIRGGTSSVTKGAPKDATSTGNIIPWMECAAVGDTSALKAEPLKAYTSAKQCYDDGLQGLITTGLDTYLASTSTQRTTQVAALSTEGKRQFALIKTFENLSGTTVGSSKTNPFLKTIRNFIAGNGAAVLGELEEKYDCSGVCEVPLFGINRDIKEGRPTQECAAGIYHAMKGSYKAEAAFSIICSLVLFCAMTAAIIIWQGPKDGDEEEEGEKTDAKEGEAPERAKVYEQTGTELQNQAPAINDDDNKVGLPPVEENKVE